MQRQKVVRQDTIEEAMEVTCDNHCQGSCTVNCKEEEALMRMRMDLIGIMQCSRL